MHIAYPKRLLGEKKMCVIALLHGVFHFFHCVPRTGFGSTMTLKKKKHLLFKVMFTDKKIQFNESHFVQFLQAGLSIQWRVQLFFDLTSIHVIHILLYIVL